MKSKFGSVSIVKSGKIGKNLIILDFDGVIADTHGLSMSILAKLFPTLSIKAFEESLSGIYSISPFRRLLRWIYSQYFLFEYARLLKPSMLFPDARLLLKELSASGTVLVLTSGRRAPVQKFLAATGLLEEITEVVGLSTSSKRVGLRNLTMRYGCDTNCCLFVSDTIGDLREASEEGIKTIGAGWGYQGSKTLREGGVYPVVDFPSEVLNAMAQLRGAV